MSRKFAIFDVDTREKFGSPGGPAFRQRAAIVRSSVDYLLAGAEKNGVTVVAATCANESCVPVLGMLPDDHLFVHECEKGKASIPEVGNRRIILLQKTGCGSPEANRGQRAWDVFHRNPNTESVVQTLHANEWIVFGHSAEVCVNGVVRKLLSFGCNVTVVSDAVVARDGTLENAVSVLQRLEIAGAQISSSKSIVNRMYTEQDVQRVEK